MAACSSGRPPSETDARVSRESNSSATSSFRKTDSSISTIRVNVHSEAHASRTSSLSNAPERASGTSPARDSTERAEQGAEHGDPTRTKAGAIPAPPESAARESSHPELKSMTVTCLQNSRFSPTGVFRTCRMLVESAPGIKCRCGSASVPAVHYRLTV